MSHSDNPTPTEGDHYEKTDVDVNWITLSVVACVLAVIASVILCDFYFDYYKDKLHKEMVVDRGFRLSGAVKAEGKETLATEKAGPKGERQIPIDKAMKIMSEENK